MDPGWQRYFDTLETQLRDMAEDTRDRLHRIEVLVAHNEREVARELSEVKWKLAAICTGISVGGVAAFEIILKIVFKF